MHKAITGDYNKYYNSVIPIVVGPNQQLAKRIIKRAKDMWYNKLGIVFDNRDTELTLPVNNVSMIAYPSHNTSSFRSLENVSHCFIDELDFFSKTEQFEVLTTAERYRGKSGAQVIAVTTPGAPGSISWQIDRDPNSIYHKLRLDWKYGEHTVYEDADLQKARLSQSWQREYCLQYLGNVGDIFSQADLDYITSHGYDLSPNLFTTAFMGVDIGFGSSDSSIVVVRHIDSVLQVVHAENIHHGVFENIVDRIRQVMNIHGVVKCFVDGSAVHIIRSLARSYGQIEDWSQIPEEYIDQWITGRKDIKIVPISFAKKHRDMLKTLMLCVSKRTLFIHPDHKDLIIGMRSATAKDDNYSLDKNKTSRDDLIDALRLSLCPISF